VLIGLLEIRKSPRVRSLGTTFEKEIDGVYDAIAQLQQGMGVRYQDVGKFSELFTNVLALLPNFFTLTPSEDSSITLVGKPALNRKFAELHDLMERGLEFPVLQTKPLKTYLWTFNEAERSTISKLCMHAATCAGKIDTGMKSIAACAAAGDSKPGSCSAIVVASTSACSSSSSSSSTAPPAPMTKKGQAKALNDKVKQQSMLKFFVPPKAHAKV